MVHIETLDGLDGSPHANLFPTEEPKTVRLTLSKGERVEPHSHSDREIVMHLVSGRIDLELDDEVYEVTAGDVVHFDGARQISPVAAEDSTALLVLAPRSEGSGPNDS